MSTEETTVGYAAAGEEDVVDIDIVIGPKMDADTALKQPNAREFIRRIYVILTTQLLLTVGVTFAFIKIPVINEFIVKNILPIFIITTSLIMCCMLSLLLQICMKQMSLTLLAIIFGIFAICFGIEVAMVATLHVMEGFQNIVLQALGITMAVFLSLTIFTFQTKIDFTFLRGFLLITTVSLCVWGIFILIFGYQNTFWYSLIGAILFGLWILFDTSLIIKRSQYLDHGEIPSWKEALIYATNIYTDIMQLFLHILDLLR